VVTSYRMDENQFQYYTRQPENRWNKSSTLSVAAQLIYCSYSFIKNGKLFVKPTLTTDRFGEKFLHGGKYSLKKEGCNLSVGGGCVLCVNRI
jgi:hypothetical protein